MDILLIVSLVGTCVTGITGALAAIEHRMDLFGVLAIAFIVGNGGATMRSMILHTPIPWLVNQNFIYASIIPATILFFFLFFKRGAKLNQKFTKKALILIQHALLMTDALGLGLFSVVGTQLALNQGADHLGSVIIGMLSAVGGGIIRDVLCNQVPLILRNEIYATVSLFGGALYLWLLPHISQNADIILVIVIVASIRLGSIYRHWRMPLIYRGSVND